MYPVTLVVDPTVLTLDTILPDQVGMTLVVRASRPQVACPDCLQLATRVHSWYTRQLADLPWQGLAVRLQLRTRRWFCDNPLCCRRIFTERFPTVAAPHSRHTTRLATILLVFGVAVGGAPGARLLQELGIVLSGVTLLRAVCRAAVPDLTPRGCSGWTTGVDGKGRPMGRSWWISSGIARWICYLIARGSV